MKPELAIKDRLRNQAMEGFERFASAGKLGDGNDFVPGLEQVIRIRTGEACAEALYGEAR